MDKLGYWTECIQDAAASCGANLSDAQIESIAESVSAAHDCFGMAFYSPPPSDRLAVIRAEEMQKRMALQREFDAYVINSENAIRRAMHLRSDDQVRIQTDGVLAIGDGEQRREI